MSYIFEHHDETVWTPSKDVADILLMNVRDLESRIGLKSGLMEYMSDTIEVEFDVLAAFLLPLGTWANPDNKSMQILIRGVVIHLFALLLCGDFPARGLDCAFPTDWIEEARVLAETNMKRLDLVGEPR
jgi:hypothetical protein